MLHFLLLYSLFSFCTLSCPTIYRRLAVIETIIVFGSKKLEVDRIFSVIFHNLSFRYVKNLFVTNKVGVQLVLVKGPKVSIIQTFLQERFSCNIQNKQRVLVLFALWIFVHQNDIAPEK